MGSHDPTDHEAVRRWIRETFGPPASPGDASPPDADGDGVGRGLQGPAMAVASASFGYGSGGPLFADAFRGRRAPSPMALVEAYRSVVYSCMPA